VRYTQFVWNLMTMREHSSVVNVHFCLCEQPVMILPDLLCNIGRMLDTHRQPVVPTFIIAKKVVESAGSVISERSTP
jgi:hypothetical protein